jgi:hypothetical protein
MSPRQPVIHGFALYREATIPHTHFRNPKRFQPLIAVTTVSGETYRANGMCVCKAF